MGAGKFTAALQWLSSHPVVCYLVLGLTTSIAVAWFSYHQANQQWLSIAGIAGDIARRELSTALEAMDTEPLADLVDALGQMVPDARVTLVSREGLVLAHFPQSDVDTETKSGKDIFYHYAEMAWLLGGSEHNSIVVNLNANGDRLHISASSNFYWQAAANHSVILFWGLVLTTVVCVMLHHLLLRTGQRALIVELMQILQQSDSESIRQLWETAGSKVTGAQLLDEAIQYLRQLQNKHQFERHERRRLEIELRKHQQDLGKLVEGRTTELIELNKRFVQKRFDAKTSALEAKQAHWKAEKANQDKTRFLAAASHDLRQPLHAMNLFVEALEPELKTEKARQIHNDLQSSLATIKELFNSLLDISKPEAGVMQPKMEDFRVQQLFDRLEIVFRQQAIENNLDLRIVASRYTLYSDPHLLQQALVNLVSNAIKYTSESAVFIGCRRKNRHVRLLVWDTGPGIPRHKQSDVFKEFIQLSNPQRDRSKGLGLGLSIFKRTCQLLEHPVRFSSVRGVGTRFEIVVPLSDVPTDNQSLVGAPIENVSGSHLQRQIVLVIDDNPSVLLGMKALLEAWNLQPRLATSVDDAVQTELLSEQPDLIISDLRLPDGANGVDAIQSIQEFFNSEIPAVLITGDTSPKRLQLATEAPYPLLHKPIKPAQLRSVCTTVLTIKDTN